MKAGLQEGSAGVEVSQGWEGWAGGGDSTWDGQGVVERVISTWAVILSSTTSPSSGISTTTFL